MADRYRVLAGNWNLANSWSTSSGGTGGASVPTSADNVYFDANTPAAATSVNVAANCLNFDCTGFNGTIQFSQVMNIYGNVTLSPTLIFQGNTGENWNLYGNGKTITSNGCKIWLRLTLKANCSITLIDDIDISQNANRTTLTTEVPFTFDPNGKNFTISSSKPSITGSFNFYNLLVQIAGGGSADNYRFILSGNLTVANNLTMISNYPSVPLRRLRVHTDYIVANPITITCNGTVTATGCDFERITGAGTASWDFSANPEYSGNCGGNTNILCTPTTTHYWVHATNNTDGMHTTTNWRTTSGGSTVSPRKILPQDTLIFDSNSFPAAGRTVNIGDTPYTGPITWSNIQNSPTWNFNRETIIFGSLVLDVGMQFDLARTNPIVMQYAGGSNLNTKNVTTNNQIHVRSAGATVTLQDNLKCSAITITSGTLDTNGYDAIMSSDFSMSGTTGPLGFANLRNSTITTPKFNIGFLTTFVLTAGTSTIKVVGPLTSDIQLQSQGQTFYNLTFDFDSTYYFGFRASSLVYVAGTFTMNPGSRYNNYNNNGLSCENISINGTSAKPCYIGKTGSGNAYLTKTGGGTVTVSNCIITRSTASPTSTFFAKKSTDEGSNSGWTFVTGWQHKINGVTPEDIVGVNFADINKINTVEI